MISATVSYEIWQARLYLAGVALAGVERARSVVPGHVPCTAHNVVDVLTEGGSFGAVLACTDTKLVGGHEVLRYMSVSDWAKNIRPRMVSSPSIREFAATCQRHSRILDHQLGCLRDFYQHQIVHAEGWVRRAVACNLNKPDPRPHVAEVG